ncbi:hypothetical protein EAO73_35155 [Streptomyces sp. col6]|nr:hypothetical protein EAO73_35155 [Streptomyces sp. col6]
MKGDPATGWGTQAETHPTLCDRCKGRAFAAELLAQTVRGSIERHDREKGEVVPEPKPSRWFLRRRT